MIWYGNAGHLCVSRKCEFHLCTEVNGYVVSTVGEYYPNGINMPMEPVGLMPKELYETMIFEFSGSRCKCGCGLPDTGRSLCMDRYATPKEANEGHIRYCEEYAKKESPEEIRQKQASCQHDFRPTFQGGDTYECRLCGKEVDMTEDDQP